MKILKYGTTVVFNCGLCGCIFVNGIKSVEDDGDGNYYSECPCCGGRCHSDKNDVKNEA